MKVQQSSIIDIVFKLLYMILVLGKITKKTILGFR